MSGSLTRRALLRGASAAALGAAGLAVFGGAALTGCSQNAPAERIGVLEVAEDDVVTLESFTEVKKPKKVYKVKKVARMDSGTLLFGSDGVVAAALCTGKTSRPLSTVKLLDLETGKVCDALDEAEGHEEDFSILSVACSSKLLLWVESNYLTGDWRVYSADLTRKAKSTDNTEYDEIGPVRPEADEGGAGTDSEADGDSAAAAANESGIDYVDPDNYDDENVVEIGGYLYKKTVTTVTTVEYKVGKKLLLDEGDASYDEPEIAVAGEQAYWIVQPAENGGRSAEDSLLKTAAGSAAVTALTSHGRFNGGLAASGAFVTCMPRADVQSGVYYQLTALQGGAVAATQIMPRSYRPDSAIYMGGKFAFSIPASYDYGEGISHVGTYYPMPNGQWLRLTRQPVTPPGLCRGWLFCKSGSRTVLVDMDEQRYFTIDAPGNSTNNGDYSAAFGDVDAIYNYAAIEDIDEDDVEKYVQVRRIKPAKA